MKHPTTERTVLDPNIRLYAYKVPGGWLYVKDEAMVFVPEQVETEDDGINLRFV